MCFPEKERLQCSSSSESIKLPYVGAFLDEYMTALIVSLYWI